MPTPREGYVLHSYGPGRYVKYVVASVHTLRRLGLTQPPRVQTGMIYAQDDARTREVDEAAAAFLERVGETHFRSRFDEGRSEETCEWSIALVMSKLDLHVFLWLQGRNSPQLDYVDSLVDHDLEFREVSYRLYTNDLVYSLRGIANATLREALLGAAEGLPGTGEYVELTPYALHFGWLHQKTHIDEFADRVWSQLSAERTQPRPVRPEEVGSEVSE